MPAEQDIFSEALQRLDMINDELCKIRRAIFAAQEGRPFNETFNEEVYIEENASKKSVRSYLMLMMVHLLELKYSERNRNHNHWRGEISNHLQELKKESEWGRRNADTNIISHMINELMGCYEDAVNEYHKRIKKGYRDLIWNKSCIPKNCPWTLENLLDDSIPDLLDKLPDPERFSVQMQLYPDICIYLDVDILDDKIIGETCDQCKHYPKCVAEYTETRYGGNK